MSIEAKDQVDLDTSDAQETTIEVEQNDEQHVSEIKKEEVDLGYRDVKSESKQDAPATEVVEDPIQKRETQKETASEDDLRDYSDKVQKRIKDLTFKYREAERREKAAIEYARGIQKKFDSVNEKFESTDENYLKEYDARVEAEKAKVKSMLKEAIDSQDSEKIMEANEALTRLAVEKEKIKISIADRENRKKQQEEQAKQPQPTQEFEQPRVSPRAQDWAAENDWFGTDRVMTSAAMGLHDELIGQGFDAESDAYYNEINKRMREYFPHKFADANDDTVEKTEPRRPVQNVAGVSRKQGGRKTVKLTKSQVAIAKKLGVPLEEYAKFVKEAK